MRVFFRPVGPHGDHLRGSDLALLGAQVIKAVLVKGAGSGIEGDGDMLAGLVAGGGDGLQDQFDRLGVGLQRRGEAALVADAGGIAGFLQDRFQGMVGFRAPAQGLAEAGRADRGDHELLQVGPLPVGVDAAVHDIEHGHGQQVGFFAAQVAVQGQLGAGGRGAGHGQAHGQDGVGAQPALVLACRPGRS